MLIGKYFRPRGHLCETDHLEARHSANSRRMEQVGPNRSFEARSGPFRFSSSDRKWPIHGLHSLRACSYGKSRWLGCSTLFSSWFHCQFTFFSDLPYKLACQPVCRLLLGGTDHLYHLYMRVAVDLDSRGLTSIPLHKGNGSSDLIVTAWHFLLCAIYDVQVREVLFFVASFSFEIKTNTM